MQTYGITHMVLIDTHTVTTHILCIHESHCARLPLPQFGCLVVNAPTANTVAAAEHGIALMCAMSRYVPQADKSMKAGKWDRTKYVGVSLVGKTLAIMGFGKVRSGDCTFPFSVCLFCITRTRIAYALCLHTTLYNLKPASIHPIYRHEYQQRQHRLVARLRAALVAWA